MTGRLRDYFALFFGVATLAVWAAIRLSPEGLPLHGIGPPPKVYEIAIVMMSVVVTFGVIFSPSRIAAICMLGIVGTGIAILFLSFGAPDLAKTQLLTELLTIVVAVLVFHRLPKFRRISKGATRLRDAAVATAFGVTMGTLALAVQSTPFDGRLTAFFGEHAVPDAKGRNVVNTILVDFRAMDTLGEIVVLALAALGILALMQLRPTREEA